MGVAGCCGSPLFADAIRGGRLAAAACGRSYSDPGLITVRPAQSQSNRTSSRRPSGIDSRSDAPTRTRSMTFRGYAATSASFRDAVLSTVMCSADGAMPTIVTMHRSPSTCPWGAGLGNHYRRGSYVSAPMPIAHTGCVTFLIPKMPAFPSRWIS